MRFQVAASLALVLLIAGNLVSYKAHGDLILRVKPGGTAFLHPSQQFVFSAATTEPFSTPVDFGLHAKQANSPWSYAPMSDTDQNAAEIQEEWFYGQIGFQVSADLSLKANGPPIEIIADTNGAVFASIYIELDKTGTLRWNTVGYDGEKNGPVDNAPIVFRNLLQNSGVAAGTNQLNFSVSWPEGSAGKIAIVPRQTGIERTYRSPNATSLTLAHTEVERNCLRLHLKVNRHRSSSATSSTLKVLNASGAVGFPEDDTIVDIDNNGLGSASLCIPLLTKKKSTEYLLEIESITTDAADSASSTYYTGVINRKSLASKIRFVALPAVLASMAAALLLWRRRKALSIH